MSQSLENSNELTRRLQADLSNFEHIKRESDSFTILRETVSNNILFNQKLSTKTPKNDLIGFVKIIKNICFPENGKDESLNEGDLTEYSFKDDCSFGNEISRNNPKITLTDFGNNFDSLIEERDQLKEKVIFMEGELQKMRNECNRLHDHLKDIKSEKDKLQFEYDELSSQLMDSIQESDDFKEKFNALELVNQENKPILEEFSLITDKITSIQEFLTEFQNDLQMEASEEDPANNKYIRTLNNLINQTIRLKEKSIVLENENESLKENPQSQTNEESLKESIKNLQEQIEKICAEKDILENVKIESEKLSDTENSRRSRQILSLQLEKEALEIRLDIMDSFVDNLKDEIEILQQNVHYFKQLRIPSSEDLFGSLDTLNEAPVKKELIEEVPEDPKNSQLDPLEENSIKNEIPAISQDDYENLEKQLKESQMLLQEKDNKLRDLEESQATRESELEKEVLDLKTGLKNILKIEEENHQLKTKEKEFVALKKTVEWKEKELENKSNQIKKLEELKTNLQQKVIESSLEIVKLKDDFEVLVSNSKILLESIESLHKNLLEKTKTLEDKLQEKEQLITDLENKVKVLNRNAEESKNSDSLQFEEKIQIFEQQLEALEKEKEELIKKSEDLEEITNNLQEQKEELEKKFDALKSKSESDEAEMKQEVENKQSRIREVELSLHVKNTALELKTSLINEINQKVESLDPRITEMELRNEKQTAELERLNMEVEKLEVYLKESNISDPARRTM